MKRVIVHPDRCYGCRTCEAACVTAHRIPADAEVSTEAIMAHYVDAMDRTRIWVEAEPITRAPVPINCRHCIEPACVNVCSTGALQQTGDEGVVVNHTEKCAGCWMCIMVCPFGAITRMGGVALKCDLCIQRGTPACVAACPNEALELVEVEVLAGDRRERTTTHIIGGGPS
ncbi:MAG TPA: 4Fe-4S dicluster domain-containing protein [Chloroflexi bacterium]|jgi:carbon-monoxide dehydrogenase iron sulfur subunit|nr:4Fe-4S dicluster domain-containing protein [Chloroflexota bacterium]